MRRPRVRHHTDDAGLAGIRAAEAINPARGWDEIVTGVHVEVEPFGTTRTGRGGPKADTASKGEGAYVEFDAPGGLVPYYCGPRNTAIIPAAAEQSFSLKGLNPVYVKVRRYLWEFWRRRPE
jgi:hypothetical protein